MKADDPKRTLEDELVAAIPNMRAFAVSLCGNPDRADDLVQETLTRAWNHLGSFQEGTNLKAWLFTILRNFYFSELRKTKREVADVDGEIAARVAVPPSQPGHMEFRELTKALTMLSDDQREALILVGAEGFSYEDAAAISGCAVGTIKSRVNRARTRLTELMEVSVELSPKSAGTASKPTDSKLLGSDDAADEAAPAGERKTRAAVE